ncbi:sulfite exporter TauE/SafE family protein [Pseudomonas sp. Z4-20]|uniref:sulfite exporter TauE/SafE family protein n=1 Tax=Pseudomonas sp. Z4-20 TaxID=2817414 RepID=UPI003DA82779
METPIIASPSLSRLFLELFWQLSILVVPAFFVTILPPPLALLAVVFLGLMMGLAARLGFSAVGRGVARLTVGAVFGLGFSLGRALPEWWGILVAIVGIVAGLACVSSWERRLGLAPASAPKNGPSAWGGNEPQLTPEGEPIRVFNHGEIAMGGPVCCDYLFPDGVLLQGLGASAVFSNDGRYFAAPVPSRQEWGLVVLDRQQRKVYRCADSEFWELDVMDLEQLSGRHSPLVDNSVRQARLDELLQTAEVTDLIPVADLWLEPGWHPDNIAHTFARSSADGRHCLEGHILLPSTFRDLDQPLEPLYSPRYAVSVNGQPSGLAMDGDAPLIWGTDHRTLVCLAREQANDAEGDQYWLWQLDSGWRALPSPWVSAAAEPSFYWHDVLSLDASHVRIGAYLDYPRPGSGRYGYRLDSIHSDTEAQTGHDAQGRVQVAEFKLTRMAIVMPLDSQGRRGDSSIETQPLLDGVRARLTWLCDNREGLGGYRCQIGEWTLPGSWFLDHRVSDCGRYLALLPFEESSKIATHGVVADVQGRRLLQGPAMWVERILDFRDGRLSLAVIAGRLDNDVETTPLQRFSVAAPAIGNDSSFFRPDERTRLFYETMQLQPKDCQLNLVAPWRLVDRPQAATADGDFIQPAPNHQDAAWLFGSETEYADSWVRAGTPRLGGHLLTASGCALVDLAPSMIWSADGRYLALTRMATDVTEQCGSYRGWQLLLLDVQDRTVRVHPQWLGNRPLFEGFDESQLRIRCFEREWEAQDTEDPGSVQAFSLDVLLQAPIEQLVCQDGFWLNASQTQRAAAWQALALPAIGYFER